ncbi:MAG TPA: preprotein translocase subunit SecE [Usitatibacteraceae bacterium]|nr:preprotein translocase subunit SecE [Usitatibacteraceae bacterium]
MAEDMAEKIKILAAALIAVAGLWGFYAVAGQPTIVRLGVLAGAFALAAGVMWFTTAGRQFLVFSRESWDEAKRVVWPTRKESLQTTGIVFAFVFVMAMLLWLIDTGLLWVTQRLLGQGG